MHKKRTNNCDPSYDIFEVWSDFFGQFSDYRKGIDNKQKIMHSLFDHDDFKHEFEYTKTLPWSIVHRCLWMIKFILTNEYVSQMNDPDIY